MNILLSMQSAMYLLGDVIIDYVIRPIRQCTQYSIVALSKVDKNLEVSPTENGVERVAASYPNMMSACKS